MVWSRGCIAYLTMAGMGCNEILAPLALSIVVARLDRAIQYTPASEIKARAGVYRIARFRGR